MANQFTIRPPENVAFAYGFDKTKIAQAVVNQELDQTSAILAAMLIDAGERQKAMGIGQPPTVAQQVLGGQPPAPPAPPAGLGATPQAAAMPPMDAAPQMGPPPEMGAPPPQEMPAPQGEMPMMAEGGMVPPYASGGGLSEVPIPDGMFDEPRNGGFGDGYAGGGMVAFAGGGPLGPYYEETVLRALPGTRVTSRQRSPAKNAAVGGAPNSYHKTDNARDFVPPPGMDMATFAATLKRTLGKGTDVINEGDHIHTEPGPKNNRVVAPMPRETDTSTAAGRAMSLEDQLAFGKSMFDGLPREAMERAKAATLKKLDPAYIEKQERLNEAEAITAAGLELIAPEEYRGENILGSIAKAVKTGLSAYGTGKKEQKAADNAAIRELMEYEELDRKTAVAAYGFGMDAYKLGVTADQAERALAFDEKKLTTTVSENALDREVQMAAAMYRAQNPSDFDTKFAMYQKSYPDFSEVAILKQMKTDGLLGSSQAGMVLPGDPGGTGGGDVNSGMSIVSSRPV